MRRLERGYSLAEMMIGLFAFSMILGSIVFLITRWQHTTSLTRLQRSLAMEARQAMQLIMNDIREASYIYHWTELDVSIATPEIPGSSAFDPYNVVTGYTRNGVNEVNGTWIPAVTSAAFAPGAIAAVGNRAGEFGLGEDDLTARLDGKAEERGTTLALVSLSEGGLMRPTYIVYFAARDPDSDDEVNYVYRFSFQPSVDAPADTWHPMNATFAEQAATVTDATRSLTITANPGNVGVLRKVTGDMGDVPGTWQLRKLFKTINRAPNPNNPTDPRRQFARGMFYIRQLHPWSSETPISPQLVEVTLIPSQRYGNRIVNFALFDRAYARNVALPSSE